MKLCDIIEGYNTVSIIGMEKNVGKTTVLNAILDECWNKKVLGLTSIGRDGEERDRVTNTHKPRIYVEKNSIIATAREALFNSDITKEILETTGISTPMGEIIIVRALTDGYVDLAGPSISSQISQVRNKMIQLGADLVLVDGALGRMGTVYIDKDSTTILSTGAALDSNLHKVVEKTNHRINLLQLKEVEERVLREYRNIHKEERVLFLGSKPKSINMKTTLESHRLIVDELTEDCHHLFIKGAIVSSLIELLIKNRNRYNNLTVVAEDGTKFFIDSDLMKKANMCGIRFKVITTVKLAGITCNPVSPFGYEFEKKSFKNEMQKKTKLPVIDVIGG